MWVARQLEHHADPQDPLHHLTTHPHRRDAKIGIIVNVLIGPLEKQLTCVDTHSHMHTELYLFIKPEHKFSYRCYNV